MSRALKANVVAVLALLVGVASVQVTTASPIKNWTSNEYVTYTDLNNALNHLHANLGHAHGPIITSADISGSAGITATQTAFPNALKLVANGTWNINPDGGTAYVPMNFSGTFAVTVTKLSTTGYTISGPSGSGNNSDGGTQVFTIIQTGHGASTPVICNPDFPVNFNGPLNVQYACTDVATPATKLNPSQVNLVIYDNRVN